jgi:hypothetical protein
MSASTKVAGVGVRRGQVFVLDANGLPFAATTNGGTMTAGTRIERLKTVGVTDPEVQRFSHYGDDEPYAQDSLPPTEIESFTFTTSKTNLTLDALIEGTKVRDYTMFQSRAANSDKRGSEPLVAVWSYRQALDVDESSATFGKLRQWEARSWPSTRIAGQTSGFEQGATDKTYQGTPTVVNSNVWGETLTENSDGATKASHFEMIFNNQPIVNVGVGDGTQTTWLTTCTPVDSANLKVFVGGSLTVPGSITYSATVPAFTVATPVPVGTQVLAIIGTTSPDL